jgi:hypothetical protein
MSYLVQPLLSPFAPVQTIDLFLRKKGTNHRGHGDHRDEEQNEAHDAHKSASYVRSAYLFVFESFQ